MAIYTHHHAPGLTEAGCEGCIAQDVDRPRPPSLLRKAVAYVCLDIAYCKVRGHRFCDSGVTGWDRCPRCQAVKRNNLASAEQLEAALTNLLFAMRQFVPDLEEPEQWRLKRAWLRAFELTHPEKAGSSRSSTG